MVTPLLYSRGHIKLLLSFYSFNVQGVLKKNLPNEKITFSSVVTDERINCKFHYIFRKGILFKIISKKSIDSAPRMNGSPIWV